MATARRSRPRPIPYLLLVLPPLFWAGHILFARITIDEIPPVQLSFSRWLLAGLIIFPLTWRSVRAKGHVIRHRWRDILKLSIFGVICFSSILYYGLQSTTVINAGLWQALAPFMILILSWMFLGNTLTVTHLAAVVLACLGAIIVLAQGNLGDLFSLDLVWGDLWVLLATISWALYSTLLKHNPLPLKPFESLTVQVLFALPILALAAVIESLVVGPGVLSWTNAGSLFYIGPVSGGLALALWIRGVADVGPGIAGIYMNLIPIFAAILGSLFLNEAFYGYHVIGILAICGGIFLITGIIPALWDRFGRER